MGIKRQQVGIICHYCGAKALRYLRDWNRSQKLNTNLFCSKKCSSIYNNKIRKFNKEKILENFKGKRYGDTPGYKRRDEYSPFKRHLTAAKRRVLDKNCEISFNITLEDLKYQWEKQKGICPYTGQEMINPGYQGDSKVFSPYKASLDRIDNSCGYETDNIEFISLMAQYAKNRFSKEQVIEFCNYVYQHNTVSVDKEDLNYN